MNEADPLAEKIGSGPAESYRTCRGSDINLDIDDVNRIDNNSGSSEYRMGSSWIETSQNDSSYASNYNSRVGVADNFSFPEEYEPNLLLQNNNVNDANNSSNEYLNPNSSSSSNSLSSSKTYSIISYSAKVLRYVQDKYYFPYFTLLISIVNWTIFLWYGYDIGYDNIKEMSPIIPTDTLLWYISCTVYPQCHFLKVEAWRLLSYSLCHSGWLHIASNTVFILGYAAVLEPLCENGLLLTIISYISGVLFGALGHNLLEPFTGIVGASAGGYGIYGSVAAVAVLDKTSPMIQKFQQTIRFAVLTQLIFEIIYPIFRFNPSISYSSHFFGFIAGLMISTNIIVFTHRKSFPIALVFFSALTFFATSFVLIYCYSVKAINVGVYMPFAAPSSCCGDMYKFAANSNVSLDTIRNEYYCHNSALQELNYYYTFDDDSHSNQNNNNNFMLPTRYPFSSFEQSTLEYVYGAVKIS